MSTDRQPVPGVHESTPAREPGPLSAAALAERLTALEAAVFNLDQAFGGHVELAVEKAEQTGARLDRLEAQVWELPEGVTLCPPEPPSPARVTRIESPEAARTAGGPDSGSGMPAGEARAYVYGLEWTGGGEPYVGARPFLSAVEAENEARRLDRSFGFAVRAVPLHRALPADQRTALIDAAREVLRRHNREQIEDPSLRKALVWLEGQQHGR